MIPSGMKIFLCSGITDMRKGIFGLSALADEKISGGAFSSGAIFVFRGRRADRIKCLWFDGQGFCLFYKCVERGNFPWPAADSTGVIGLTGAQLSMLLEGIDWRSPRWSAPPLRGS
jgi:transposase